MKSTIAIQSLVFVLVASVAFAQQPPVSAPEKEHEWLKQFVGEWQLESTAVAPGQPEMKCEGTMRYRMLGGFWAVSEVELEMMGARVSAVQTIGYDTKLQKYVGTWVDSMFNHMWKYEGSVDDSGKILTLEAEGPSFEDPAKTSKYRDVYEFKSKDHFVMTSGVQGEDGNWITFQTGNARRKK